MPCERSCVGRIQASGPITGKRLAEVLNLDVSLVDAALAALEGEGFVLRGRFTPASDAEEWC